MVFILAAYCQGTANIHLLQAFENLFGQTSLTNVIGLHVSRDNDKEVYGDSWLATTIDPSSWLNGQAPIEWVVEGVYYKESSSVTSFWWVYKGYAVSMKISKELMDQIREKDPEALKGALFELRKVEVE